MAVRVAGINGRRSGAEVVVVRGGINEQGIGEEGMRIRADVVEPVELGIERQVAPLEGGSAVGQVIEVVIGGEAGLAVDADAHGKAGINGDDVVVEANIRGEVEYDRSGPLPGLDKGVVVDLRRADGALRPHGVLRVPVGEVVVHAGPPLAVAADVAVGVEAALVVVGDVADDERVVVPDNARTVAVGDITLIAGGIISIDAGTIVKDRVADGTGVGTDRYADGVAVDVDILNGQGPEDDPDTGIVAIGRVAGDNRPRAAGINALDRTVEYRVVPDQRIPRVGPEVDAGAAAVDGVPLDQVTDGFVVEGGVDRYPVEVIPEERIAPDGTFPSGVLQSDVLAARSCTGGAATLEVIPLGKEAAVIGPHIDTGVLVVDEAVLAQGQVRSLPGIGMDAAVGIGEGDPFNRQAVNPGQLEDVGAAGPVGPVEDREQFRAAGIIEPADGDKGVLGHDVDICRDGVKTGIDENDIPFPEVVGVKDGPDGGLGRGRAETVVGVVPGRRGVAIGVDNAVIDIVEADRSGNGEDIEALAGNGGIIIADHLDAVVFRRGKCIGQLPFVEAVVFSGAGDGGHRINDAFLDEEDIDGAVEVLAAPLDGEGLLDGPCLASAGRHDEDIGNRAEGGEFRVPEGPDVDEVAVGRGFLPKRIGVITAVDTGGLGSVGHAGGNHEHRQAGSRIDDRCQ